MGGVSEQSAWGPWTRFDAADAPTGRVLVGTDDSIDEAEPDAGCGSHDIAVVLTEPDDAFTDSVAEAWHFGNVD
jgi:hypothetical protein